MAKVLLYTTRWCPFCVMAKRFLAKRGLAFEEVAVDCDATRRAEMLQRSGGCGTVPQIFVGGRHVGGYEDMVALDQQGGLESLLR